MKLDKKAIHKLDELVVECKEDCWLIVEPDPTSELKGRELSMLVERQHEGYLVSVDANDGGYWQHLILESGQVWHKDQRCLPTDVLIDLIERA